MAQSKQTTTPNSEAEELAARLKQMAGTEPEITPEEPPTAEESEIDRYESLIEQMTFLRDKGHTLPREVRKDRAARAAREMAMMMGGLEGEESDDEEDDILQGFAAAN